jgi:hypothetical protein
LRTPDINGNERSEEHVEEPDAIAALVVATDDDAARATRTRAVDLTRRLQPQRLVRTNVVEHRHPVVARALLNGTIAEISSTGLLSETTDVSSSDGGAGRVCDKAFLRPAPGCRAARTGVVSVRHGMLRRRKEGS